MTRRYRAPSARCFQSNSGDLAPQFQRDFRRTNPGLVVRQGDRHSSAFKAAPWIEYPVLLPPQLQIVYVTSVLALMDRPIYGRTLAEGARPSSRKSNYF